MLIDATSDVLPPLVSCPVGGMARPALFLDLDGVLAPIVETPGGVMPSARRTQLLHDLQTALDGRIAVLSGRPIAEVDRICEGAVRVVAGIHGLERRGPGGEISRALPAPGLAPALAALQAFAATRPGLSVEDKGVAVGLHYRQAPDHAAAVVSLARHLAAEHGLGLQQGHMVAELKTPGADKGRALTAFMAELVFHDATPIMIGDDLTDEYGFVAATALGGFGVLVGPTRVTAARYGLADPEAVLDWLDDLKAAV